MVADGSGSVRSDEVEEPVAEPHEAVLAVDAYSVNRGETFVLEEAEKGWRPGKDVAGTVVVEAADGSGPTRGTRVVAHLPGGGWAERAAVGTEVLAALPDHIDAVTAAALPLAGLTAVRLLRRVGGLIGKRILITGASGGVGHYVTALAVSGGADVVAVSRTCERGEALRALGATTVVDVEEATGWFDVALESVGGTSLAAVRRKVQPGGQIIWFGQASREPSVLDFFDWVQDTAGAPITQFHYADTPEHDGRDLATLVRLVSQQRLHPEIGVVQPWEQTGDVIDSLRGRLVRGNAVLAVTESARGYAEPSPPGASHRPEKVLRHYLDVLEAGDLAAVAECFSEDATWWVHGESPLSGTRLGRAEIVQFLNSASTIFVPGSQRFQRGQMTVQGDRAALEWRVTGVGAATGLAYDNSYCGVFVIASGRIVEVREYLDSLHATHVLFGVTGGHGAPAAVSESEPARQ